MKVLGGVGVTQAKGQQSEMDWPELRSFIKKHSVPNATETEDEKRAGRWFSTAEYRGAHRRRENIIGKSGCIVADLDRVDDPAAVLHALEDYEYIAWTTWNSTPEHQRWRVVLPVQGGVSAEDYGRLVEHVLEPLSGYAKIDLKSKSPEQLWFLPSHKRSQRKNHRVWENSGKWVRPTIDVDFAGVVNVHHPETIHEERNNSLVKRLQSSDARACASEAELMALAMDWNARLPKPMELKEVRDVVRKTWKWLQSPHVKSSGGEWESRLSGWKPKASAADLLKIPTVLYFVRWWIQHGHAGQLVAEGGTGKTTILLYLLIAAAAETDWLGLRIERYGTCVLLSLDDSQDDLDAVLAEIVLAMGLTSRQVDLVRRRVRLISLRGCDVSFTRGGQRTDVADRIANSLSGISDLVCVVLDTQRQFSGGDSNEDRVAMVAAQSVSAIAERLKVACILTHHVGKGQSRSGVDDMYIGLGSTAAPDTLRFVLRLERMSWDEMRETFEVPEGDVIAGDVFRLSSKRGSLRVRAPASIYFARDGFQLTRLDFAEKSAEQRHSEDIARVVAAIDAAGTPLSANTIAQSLKGRRRARLAKLKAFVASGWLVHDSAGRLAVTDAGRAVTTGAANATPNRSVTPRTARAATTGDRYRDGNQGHHPAQRKTAAAGVGSDRSSGHQRSPRSPVRKKVRK